MCDGDGESCAKDDRPDSTTFQIIVGCMLLLIPITFGTMLTVLIRKSRDIDLTLYDRSRLVPPVTRRPVPRYHVADMYVCEITPRTDVDVEAGGDKTGTYRVRVRVMDRWQCCSTK